MSAMEKMIGTAALGLGMLAAPIATPAAEPAKPAAEATKPTKEQRIAQLDKEIAGLGAALRGAKGNGTPSGDAQAVKIAAKIEYLTLERDVVAGKITKVSAEAKVKTAEDALKKAEDAKADEKVIAPLKAALDAAKKELAAVTAFEARGEF